MSYKLLVGAQVSVYINGTPFAKVFDFQYTISTPKKEIKGIDSVENFELAVTGHDVSGTMSIYRMTADGGLEGAGITAPTPTYLSREKYFTLTLVDQLTDTVIFEANYASITGQSWSVPVKGILTGSISFKALSATNEARKM